MENQISFSSDMSNLCMAENCVDKISDEFHISDELFGNIKVSVVEAVSNAILHGNHSDTDKTVYLEYNVGKKQIIFRIKDEGKGFDYENVPDPTSPENLEKPYGRGIFLIKSLSDETRFYDNGRIIEIIFKRN